MQIDTALQRLRHRGRTRSRDSESRAGEEQSSPLGRARVSVRVAEFGRNVVAQRSVVFSGRP